jgi:hypothetical protein
LDGFVPKVGDWILTEIAVNPIATIIIEGRVIRRKSDKQLELENKAWSNSWRIEKLEAYLENGEALKERAFALHPTLADRMKRFDRASGAKFWIEDAPYEMAVMEGAQALLDKVEELGFIGSSHFRIDSEVDDVVGAVSWINDWWDINSEKGGYDYKKQMEMVPNFGEGHSGNTAAAAVAFAKGILTGEYSEEAN